jgi:peptide-methionine (S)-S-oxide reductase
MSQPVPRFCSGLLSLALMTMVHGAVSAAALPTPAVDIPATAAKDPQTAVFAGGCFWGVEAVFRHVKGVSTAVSGYAGGYAKTAIYEVVTSGATPR